MDKGLQNQQYVIVGIMMLTAVALSVLCATYRSGGNGARPQPLAIHLAANGVRVFASKTCPFCKGLQAHMEAEAGSAAVADVMVWDQDPPSSAQGVPQFAKGQSVVFVGGIPPDSDKKAFMKYSQQVRDAIQ